MKDGMFEWDDGKAASNFAKHGVMFDAAKDAFSDPFAIEQLDDRYDYGELRYVLLGMVEGRLLTVTYTEQDGVIRIISARAAEPFERREYHEQNT